MEKIMALVMAIAETMAKRVSESCATWPSWANPLSVLERIPQGEEPAPGLDAFLACCLWLVPEDAWPLCSALHVAWNGDEVDALRAAIAEEMPADAPATWWAAMSSICEEGTVDRQKFAQQIALAHLLRVDPFARRDAAKRQMIEMQTAFDLDRGYPCGTEDGCLQGAYIAGHDWAVHDARETYGIYFVGTCRASLGLEDFEWGTEVDEQDRPKSGPVFGSPQFVKCADEAELERVLDVVRKRFG